MLQLGIYGGVPSSGAAMLLDATPFARSCVATTDEHGFEHLAAQIDRSLVESFRIYDQPGLLYIGVAGYGQIIWEGRLEDPTLQAGAQGSGIALSALGYWRSLSDTPYLALWSTTQVGEFLPTTGVMSAAYSEAERWQRDTNNRLFIALVKNTTYTLNKAAGLLFGIPHRGSRQIIGMQFSLDMNLPAQFTFRAVSFDSDISGPLTGGTVQANLVGTGVQVTRAYHLVFAAGEDDAGIDLLCNTGVLYAAETAASYVKVTNVRLVTSTTNRINTTLTANRAAGAGVTATVGSTAGMYAGMDLVMNSGANPSEIVTVTSVTNTTQFVATFVGNYVIGNAVQGFRVLADEIAGHTVSVISALNSSQLSSSTALIQSPGLDLLDENYVDADISEALTRLASLGDTAQQRYEVGVYEDRVLFFRPIGSAGQAWYVDATEMSLARTLEALANATFATYADANGRRQLTTAATNTTSITRYGIRRQAIVAANTTNATLAATIRDTALADSANPKPRAIIRFDAVYGATGARYPLWLVRAGDTITIRNLPVGVSTSIDLIRTFRITHTSYDAVADTLDVEPEVPPPTLEVLLARRAEGIGA